MKYLLLILLSLSAVGCDNRQAEQSDAERKEKFDERYKTPPPSDRSKDKRY
jgi:hypothetical protein